ncbi:Gfo/Idh/MocA family oxidoreductase [Proteiniclasticum sp. SCR006]|uniref:Gfo/Idh/MocA family oxidoreductase n=1 Tax=Proteiniclasticum aestuarii TaxID=2817862 RepID=A0A939HBC1_9CLOT|nr:Gfo/Idh/MocA family oxidoreductase [Proteiniclasticum aestuarii]MBO1265195.1 Gfo/Idh/MocA family oxidoreductase [Proteiniclasticum aestuarii]
MIKVGIVGIGSIAEDYIDMFSKGLINGAELSALASRNQERLSEISGKYALKDTRLFTTLDEMIAGDTVDAVLITTPHALHPSMAMKAMEKDKHMMIEKPLGIRIGEVEEMVAAAAGKPHLTAGVMFNNRSSDIYNFVKRRMEGSSMGELRRVVWQVTNQYRTYDYYERSTWRGSYETEGGGVLINQAIHQLDTLLWMTDLPQSVTAFTKEGFHRPLTAENDVMIQMFYPNGASGQFMTSTHESPGTNRFELSFSKGQIVIEDDSAVKITTLTLDEEDFARTMKGAFPEVPHAVERVNFPKLPNKELQRRLLNNFIQTILGKEEIICPLKEGMKSVRMLNATYLSAWQEKKIPLDFDAKVYDQAYEKKIQKK